MDFLTPIFAAVGLAAASVPVLLHMLRRAPTQDMPFSLVRFLKPSQPKLTKRSSIEHWPLMLLRILALVLIGLAFARPFLREVIPLLRSDDVVQSVTILVDKSASMRRDGIYEQVQQLVQETIDDLGDQDMLSVSFYSTGSQLVLSRENWGTANAGERMALVKGVTESYEPDWLATDTGSAMRIAADDLAAESKGRFNISRRRLVLITDFQRGSDLDELKSGDWPASVEVELKTVHAENRGNAGVTFVQDQRQDRTRVRVASAGDSVQQEFELQPFDASGAHVGEAVRVTVAPGQRRSLILPAGEAASGKTVVGVELLGDEHPFDNVIDLPELENPVVKVAHIGPSTFNDPESMRYYLQRVLSGNVERDVRLVDLIKDAGVLLPVPSDVQLAVITDAVPAGLIDSVSEFLGRGGTLLVAPPSVQALESLRKFLPVNLQIQEADVDEYAMFSSIDFDHPLFSAFADGRFSDFSSIRFWKHRNLQFSEEDREEGDWSIVAKFDTGLPAIADIRSGETGRILLFATGWQPDDSQLALSTRFPPLLTRVLSLASPAQKDQIVQTVGDVIRPGEMLSLADWTITLPDGDSTPASDFVDESKETDPLAVIVPLEQPGRYTISGKTDEGEKMEVTLIAGLAASESRTEMLPVGQLQVLGIGVKSSDASVSGENDSEDGAADGQLSASELEEQQKWWRWLLLAGLGCLLLESLWASVIEKRQPAEA